MILHKPYSNHKSVDGEKTRPSRLEIGRSKDTGSNMGIPNSPGKKH